MVDAVFTVQLAHRACEAPCDEVTQDTAATVLIRPRSQSIKENERHGPSHFNIYTLVGHDAALAGVSCGGHRKGMMAGDQVGSSIWRDIMPAN